MILTKKITLSWLLIKDNITSVAQEILSKETFYWDNLKISVL